MSVELAVFIGYLAHWAGDYVFQSSWMAQTKTKSWTPAIVHAFVYTLCFVTFFRNPIGLWIIFITHLVIDRYRLARYLVWAKDFLAPPWIERLGKSPTGIVKFRNLPWDECQATGYHPSLTPPHLATYLMIKADNWLHVVINTAAIYAFWH
jgi:hypothetical protein